MSGVLLPLCRRYAAFDAALQREPLSMRRLVMRDCI